MNADDEAVLVEDYEELLQYNLFAYCWNNPVNMSDLEGESPANIIGAIAGGVGGAALGIVIANALGLKGAKRTALIVAATAGGAVLGAFLGPYVAKLGKQVLSAVKTYGKKVVCKVTKKGCFVAGTKVMTERGNVPIEDIKVGDLVYSENPETGERGLKTVVQTFINESSELVHVYIGGEEIVATPEHPFYVPKKGWVGAIDLRAGDILVLQSGEYVIVEKVQHEILEAPITVYNFEVADFHTYYVSEENVLVHNMCAKKSDIKQIEDVAKKMKMTSRERREFGDYVEWLKKGKRNDKNFSFKELIEIAKEFLEK